ncbi:MAG: Zn-ribbon domain-containing OB-fold protein [Candidatus Geothermincolia bacterium]
MLEEASVSGGREPVTEIRGELDIKYRYAYGEHYDRFFREMRDNRRIMAVKCPKCGAVLLPPRPYCGFCYTPVEEWIEVSDVGTLLTFTVVYLPFVGQPTEPPYVYAFIKLDGADVQFPHILGEVDPADVRVGMRLKARWAEKRTGTLHDIEYFRPV